jgi:hypothetical protein
MESLPEKKNTVRKCSDSNIVETPQLNDEADLLNDEKNESVVKTVKAVDSVNTNVHNVSSCVIENTKPKITDTQPDTIFNIDTVLIKKKGVIFKRK